MPHRIRSISHRAFLALATVLFTPLSLWPQDNDFPDVDVTAASREWYEAPIIWIASGVILLLLLWVSRRHWGAGR